MAYILSFSTPIKASSFDLPQESQSVLLTTPSLKVPNTPNEPILENLQIKQSDSLTPRTIENITISPQQKPILTPRIQSSSKIQKSLSEYVLIETLISIKNLAELAFKVDLNQGFRSPIE